MENKLYGVKEKAKLLKSDQASDGCSVLTQDTTNVFTNQHQPQMFSEKSLLC
jgi:hypothetical protein